MQTVCCNLMFVFDPDKSLSPGHHFVTSHTQLSWDSSFKFGRRYSAHWRTLSHSIEVPGKISYNLRRTTVDELTQMSFVNIHGLLETKVVQDNFFLNLLQVALTSLVSQVDT